MTLNNVPNITTGEIPDVIREAWRARMPVMLWGEPGIGKSQAISQSAPMIMKSEGLGDFGVLDRRLTQYEPVDVRGIPRVVSASQLVAELSQFLKGRTSVRKVKRSGRRDEDEQATDMMDDQVCEDEMALRAKERIRALEHEVLLGASYSEWSRPDVLPRTDRHPEHGILFLDELSNATPDVQAPAYQLILDRALGDYRLPEGWSVVAAGNRVEDRSGTYEMSSALANRFAHFNVQFSFEDWLTWAYKSKVSEDVIAFHRHSNGKDVLRFNPSVDDRAFPTPRSWEAVSKIMRSVRDAKIRDGYVQGLVGTTVGVKFCTYCNLRVLVPDIDNILSGWGTPDQYDFPSLNERVVSKDGSASSDAISLVYMVITGIASRTSRETVGTIWDVIDHLTESKRPGLREIGVTLCVDCMRVNKEAVRGHDGGRRFMAFGKKNIDAVAL
jgi:hypothetical protein